MIPRPRDEAALRTALERSPVVLLVGARQVGKTTLARTIARPGDANYFDLEDPVDLARLYEPMITLGGLRGTVVIDEVQRRPDLFPVLRVLADREDTPTRFLVLGSASPSALRQSSESLAGRIEIVELNGFGLADSEMAADEVWLRGGYPRSLLAASSGDSHRWRMEYVRTLANRDLQDFGLRLPGVTIERFLGLIAHYHGNLWNAAPPARALDIAETTVRRYIDGLADALLVRILLPWHQNSAKRLVRTPKVYLRDSGIAHALLGITDHLALQRHPQHGATWESLMIDEVLRRAPDFRPWFWRTSNNAELDLLLEDGSRRIGFEIKRADAPRLTPSMRSALDDLRLDRLWVVYPGARRYALADNVTVLPVQDLIAAADLAALESRTD